VHFKRESLLGREIDMLNLAWVWGTFRRAFTGADEPPALLRYLQLIWKRWRGKPAEPLTLLAAARLDGQNLLRWYRVEVGSALRGMRVAFGLTLAMGLVGAVLAYLYVDARLPSTLLPPETLRDAMKTIRAVLIDDSVTRITAGSLFWHNLRAELIIMALGAFSFGVLGLLVLLGNISLIGGVLAATKLVGLSPVMVFLAGILPHGILELPSVILAGSAVLYLGVRLVTPLEGKSIGETMIITLADVMKVFVAICIPLLLLAGLIEANLTPHLLLTFLGRTLEFQP